MSTSAWAAGYEQGKGEERARIAQGVKDLPTYEGMVTVEAVLAIIEEEEK